MAPMQRPPAPEPTPPEMHDRLLKGFLIHAMGRIGATELHLPTVAFDLGTLKTLTILPMPGGAIARLE